MKKKIGGAVKKVKKREKSEETGNDGTRNIEYVKKRQEKTEKL